MPTNYFVVDLLSFVLAGPTMPPNTAANHGLPVQLSTPGASSIKPMPSGVQGNREEWLPLPPARLLQLMKSLAMVYVVAYLITQRHQWKTMIRGKMRFVISAGVSGIISILEKISCTAHKIDLINFYFD